MKAYVVCLTNERYLPGLYAIAFGLRKVKAEFPLVVLVPEDNVGLIDALEKRGYEVRTAAKIKLAADSQNFYWDDTFFKLAAASMIEYEKIVLLDCDMLILENLDFMFQLPHLSATVNGKATYTWKKSFSSGVLVLEPSEAYFSSLLSIGPNLVKEFNASGRFAGDQDVFNASCPDWYEKKELHFHERYNESLVSVRDFYRAYPKEKLAVIHFGGPIKPWDYSFIRFVGVFFLKYLLRGDHHAAHYLLQYYRLTKRSCNKKVDATSGSED